MTRRLHKRRLNGACEDQCAPLLSISPINYIECVENCAEALVSSGVTTQTYATTTPTDYRGKYIYADGVYHTFYINNNNEAVLWNKTNISDSEVRAVRIKVHPDKLLSFYGAYATQYPPTTETETETETTETNATGQMEMPVFTSPEPTQAGGSMTQYLLLGGLVLGGVYVATKKKKKKSRR
jgi:hypothetical protein